MVVPRSFPPGQQAQAIACEWPKQRDQPLSRYSLADIQGVLEQESIVERISRSTLCRWLKQAALKPWKYRSWLFPRDPDFESKAGRVLDLYQGQWEGSPLGEDDYVLNADEKSQLQVLRRGHETRPTQAGHRAQVEFEYEREGTVVYQAALEVQTEKIVGQQFPASNCKASFDDLVAEVMAKKPYCSANRVFWIVDNGPAHHPATFAKRLQQLAPQAQAVHLPTHASWLAQIELYFSILERKALTPRDVDSKEQMKERIRGFQTRYAQTAKPFHWKFSRQGLEKRRQALEKG